jgi:hypothetical protein
VEKGELEAQRLPGQKNYSSFQDERNKVPGPYLHVTLASTCAEQENDPLKMYISYSSETLQMLDYVVKGKKVKDGIKEFLIG